MRLAQELKFWCAVALIIAIPVQTVAQTLEARPPQKKDKPGFIFPPLASFALPGFDQWRQGDYLRASSFSVAGASGAALWRYNEDYGRTTFGQWVYFEAGALSAHNSFLRAVQSRKEDGEFSFIKKQDSELEIFTAPFRLDYLREPIILVPFAFMFANSMYLTFGPRANRHFDNTPAIYKFTVTYPGPAAEEMMMRGYLMPVSMQYLDNPWAANLITSLVFGGYHCVWYGTDCWQQFVGGLYLGYLTQQHDWGLTQSIFFHSWWNIFIGALPDLVNGRAPSTIAFPQMVFRF